MDFARITNHSHKTNTKDLRIFLGIWAGIFALFLGFGYFAHDMWRIWALVGLAISLVFIPYPRPIAPLYRVWVKLGEMVGFVISRSILLVLWVVIFCPIGLFFRVISRDVLQQKPDKKAQSYFIKRTTPPQSLKNQF
ncbi:hypothetical protein BKN38_01485 [Helicobacter sp. CLO-3]|uniref:hypothetical protein n=1 Tax=unclassified Helicobacter TaxID=2593540 RepID=UPI0008051559|nr:MULTISPECIES: hypothetical protein [unclassified Helicobacter]OBV29778.1 hypothetical protein BA723_00285 [Helicobacter sp. CLO-3]OHU85232.1 hypothetical protein BKN38_01485 [Helicobacter sp. CLO-3]